jgi:hypothetical protein
LSGWIRGLACIARPGCSQGANQGIQNGNVPKNKSCSSSATRVVSHCDPCHLHNKKVYLTTKEELWKLKYFTMQRYNLPKNPLKENPKSFNIL